MKRERICQRRAKQGDPIIFTSLHSKKCLTNELCEWWARKIDKVPVTEITRRAEVEAFMEKNRTLKWNWVEYITRSKTTNGQKIVIN